MKGETFEVGDVVVLRSEPRVRMTVIDVPAWPSSAWEIDRTELDVVYVTAAQVNAEVHRERFPAGALEPFRSVEKIGNSLDPAYRGGKAFRCLTCGSESPHHAGNCVQRRDGSRILHHGGVASGPVILSSDGINHGHPITEENV